MPPMLTVPPFLDPALRRRWRAVLVALLAASTWFAFAPHPPGVPIAHGDKVEHVVGFAVLAAAAALSLRAGRRSTVAVAVGLAAYGAFIEVVQSWLPTRWGDVGDFAADVVGIALGVAAIAALRRRYRRDAWT